MILQSATIKVMCDAAIKAGRGMMRDFGEVDHLQISRKGPSNFVTKADIKAEKIIVEELSKVRPDFGYLLEERGEIPGKSSDFRFIVDPLDGTNNFIHAIPYFCVSIALEARPNPTTSEIVAGVIYDPLHNELFWAEKGKGAFLNDRKIIASRRDQIDSAMFATGNPRVTLSDMSEKIAHSGAVLRFFGSAALDMAYVAAGRLDAAWYHIVQPWDIAAGLLLVREAGGVVKEKDGADATLKSGHMIASSSNMLATVLDLVGD